MQTAKQLVQIVALVATWIALLFVLTFFTELILAPWDTAIDLPAVGTWQRTFNDFVDLSIGKYIVSVPLLLLSMYTTVQAVRSRSTPIWKFIVGNVVFLVALWFLFLAAAGINNTILFPYPPVAYDPNYEGYHRSIFPLAVMLGACGLWAALAAAGSLMLHILAALLLVQAGWMIERIESLADVAADINESLVLAPDGTLAAWITADHVCVYRITPEAVPWQQLDCRDLPAGVEPDRASLSWNPGGYLLVFSGSGDIWTYDTTSARFTNLTPDDDQSSAAPVWQGNDVSFLRGTWLYKVYGGGGFEPAPLFDLSQLMPRLSEVTLPPVASPDSTLLAVIAMENDVNALGNGVYILGASTADRIASLPALQASAGAEADVNPLALAWAGDNALIVAVGTGNTVENFIYVDLRTRELTPLVGEGTPQVGLVAPDRFVLVHSKDDPHTFFISGLALPPDGSSPQPIGTIGGCLPDRIAGSPAPLNTLTSVDSGLIFNCLIGF